MTPLWWIVAGVGGVFVAGAIFLARHASRSMRQSRYIKARRQFRLQREYLEAKFFELASTSGKPRGLEWTQCEFEDDVSYARDRQSGDLAAFVAITVAFAAIEGGGMEEVEAVSNLRAASAVFVHRSGQWHTAGRVLFNLNPTEAIEHFHSSFDLVAHDFADRV